MRKVTILMIVLSLLLCASPALSEDPSKGSKYILVVDKPIYFNNGIGVFNKGAKIWVKTLRSFGDNFIVIYFDFGEHEEQVYISKDNFYSISNVIREEKK